MECNICNYLICLLFFLSVILYSSIRVKQRTAIDLNFMKNQSREKIGILLDKQKFRIGMEIGVQKGLFSNKLLHIWKSCREYTMIDPWIKQRYYDDQANVNMTLQNQFFKEAMKVVESYSETVQFKIFKTESDLIYKTFMKKSYDFIYIDARHDYFSVKNDIKHYYPILRKGGILCGDDYTYSPGRWRVFPDGKVDDLNRAVKGAVDEFAKSKRLKLYLSKDKSWFVII